MLLIATLSSCATVVPPAPPLARQGTMVSAPFDRAWNAVIDVFAAEVITIETMERASGFVVASRGALPRRTRADSASVLRMADCGRIKATAFGGQLPTQFLPNSAKYNVLVREGGEGTRVLVTAKFMREERSGASECSSKGAFEQAFEQAVKEKAEAPTP